MGLSKESLPIPLTGGLSGKSAPLVVEPGSHLTLDNVRHERTGEWRRRHGWSQNSLDTLPAIGGRQPVRAVELPNGGVLALTEMSSDVNTCARLYSPTAASRWSIPPQFRPLYAGTPVPGSGQASLPLWSRTSISYVDSPQAFTTLAIGNGLQFYAQTMQGPPTQATAMFKTLAEGIAQGLPFTFGSTAFVDNQVRPRAVYFAGTPGTFALFWIEGTNLYGKTWDGNGVPGAGATLISTDVASGSCLDALIYPGSATVSVAYQGNTGHAKVLEVTSSLGVSSSGVCSASGAQVVQILPNPDVTTFRFIATSATNLQQVSIMGSAGALISTTTIDTKANVDSFAGVAVNGGGGAVLVYHTPVFGGSGGGIWAWKMVVAGGPGTPKQIIPDGLGIYIDSNGWREPGADAMHWIAGLHICLPGTTITPSNTIGVNGTDFQHSYFEMALEYGGVNTVTNQFTEPQARMIPLQAGPPTGCDPAGAIWPGAQPQVVRTGPSAFSVPLFRLVRVDTGAAAQVTGQLSYAVDRWDVLHLNGSNLRGVNLGQGLKGKTASYLPSGHLIQTVDGQEVVALGASAQPYQPTLTAGAGGGLTPNATYGYVTVDELLDEAGNLWRSTPSIPAWIALNSSQSVVFVTSKRTPLEASIRRRTTKFYRTSGNGSTYFLAGKFTDTPDNNTTVFLTDQISDAQLGTQLITALSSGDVGEQPATIIPSFSHVAMFDGRLWGIDRDFPTRVWYSKPILQGTSPEFPASFNFDVPDELGPFTGMSACDDKLVFFKSPLGVYYVQQGGPANDGSGNQYSIARVSSETGLLAGQPYVSTGAEVYFGARQDGGVGIYRLNRSLEIDFVGLPVDQYLAQPEINATDTLIAATYSDTKNEIRFMGLGAQYVFDRIHGLWVRDTFPSRSGVNPLVVLNADGADIQFLDSNGIVWTEGDETNLDDPSGGTYKGIVRSAWLRPAQMGGYLRLYRVLLLLDVTGDGGDGPQQQLIIYTDDQELGAQVYTSPLTVVRGKYEARGPGDRKLSSFSIEIDLASSDTAVRLDGWTALVGIKYGSQKLPAAQRWQ